MARGVPLFTTWTGRSLQIAVLLKAGGKVIQIRSCHPGRQDSIDSFVADVVARYRASAANTTVK